MGVKVNSAPFLGVFSNEKSEGVLFRFLLICSKLNNLIFA